MQDIKNKIIKEIQKNNGSISIEKFTLMAMFDNESGYYISKKPIGKQGDFVTAPEISQLFGELIGLYVFDYWNNYINKDFNLIELGPGNGTMMNDLVNINHNFPEYCSLLNIILIEKNKFLIKKQKKLLLKQTDKFKKISWLKEINKIKSQFESVIIANEFFDCFPIRQFYKIDKKYFEKIVKYNKKNNIFYIDNIKKKLTKNLKKEIDHIYYKNKYKDGNIIEISLLKNKYLKDIGIYLKKNNGLLIIIDYGNFESTGESTLQSVRKHKKTNFLLNPGKQDITYMMDFSLIKNIFLKMKLNVYGPYFQGNFFKSLGIEIRKEKIIKNATNYQKIKINKSVQKIIDKKEMGNLFKVLIISSKKLKNYE